MVRKINVKSKFHRKLTGVPIDLDCELDKVGKKLTNKQLEYLCEYYYTINKFVDLAEIKRISKEQWNIEDFDFYIDLMDWFRGRQMGEEEIAQRRDMARKAAA